MADPNYDKLVEVWRSATRRVLAAGSDNPRATADDLTDMLENLIDEEEGE